MKNFIFKLVILCLLLTSTKNLAQCGSGTLTLSSQQAVNDFPANYQGCTGFIGNLDISGADITDLTPLVQLSSITGNLRLWGNSSLTNIQGLNNLTSIGGILDLSGYNFPLANLNGLESLETVGGMVSIQGFQNLVSVQGLSNLTSVGGNFLIQNNNNIDFVNISLPALTYVGYFNVRNNSNLSTITFSSLQSVGNAFHIVTNVNLVTADFPALEVVGADLNNDFQINNNGGFEVFQCVSLINPDFSELQTIKGYLDVIQNDDLENLGFQNLTVVLRRIRINNNPSLSSIDGLSGLSGNITDLSIIGSDITNLDALENITSVATGTIGDLIIKDNPSLNDISGLGSLTYINRNLEIHNNDALENLNGLNALITINYGYLSVQDNDVLEEINGLQNLTSVGALGNVQGILINNNPALQNLNGLASLATLKGSLTLRNNTSLTDVSAINITSFLTGASNSFILDGNNALQNLSGMYIQELKGQVQIINNTSLQSVNLTVGNPSQTTSLLFENNPLLNDVSGFGTVTQVTGIFRVLNNSSLTNLNGLNITDITGNLIIDTNSALENIDGLSSLVTTGTNSSLEILNNVSLLHLNGLANLTKAGRILIQNNTFLKNIDGLSSVTQLTITSNTKLLSVFNNPNLESIQGIRNLNQTTIANLVISTNPKVAVCDLKNICEYLGTAKPRSINGNAAGCNSVSEIQNSCPTIWNGTVWSNGEPDASRSAIIEGNLDLNTNLEAKNFTVNSGIFSILPDASLSVYGSVINNTEAENFVVQNEGNLVQTNEASLRKNQGEITVYRENVPFKRLDYTMWSSPVADQNLFGFSPETVNGVTNYLGSAGRIYVYEGASGYVNPVPFDENTVFEQAKGYLFRAPNNWSQTVPVAYEGQFIGVPNNGTIQVATHQDSYTSVGNPYPSNIDAQELLSANPNLMTLYFWTNTYAPEGGEYTQNNYATYTLVGGTAVNEEGTEPNDYVSVGQGFIVYNEATQITFNNDMRAGNPAYFFKSMTTEKHRFWLNLKGENDNKHNQILVGYMEGATQNIDPQIDGKLFGYNGSALYSIIENEKLVIQGRALPFESSDVVALGFKAENQGAFTISLASSEGLFTEDNVIIYLKDNYTNVIHNLMENPYVFHSDSGEFNQRFEVIYQAMMNIENPNEVENLHIYKQNEQIVVSSDKEIQKVRLYDLQGRLVHHNDKVNSNEYRIHSAGISSQVLIINVESNGKVANRKLIN